MDLLSALVALVALSVLANPAAAHMQLHFPSPFNASNNPHRITRPDPYLQYPYDCCGPNDRWAYPCRGYHSLLGTPDGAPTATWERGSAQSWSITGIGNHWGGSCQVGFSVDGGRTFHVATSYEGNCPHRHNGLGPEGQDFEFVIPADLDAGVQVFAWVWYNREQELNMNCAAVNITAGNTSSSSAEPTASYGSPSRTLDSALAGTIAFSDRPRMFIADDGEDCLTPKTTAELKYPNPGPDVVPGDGVYPLELPSGKCGEGGGYPRARGEGEKAGR